MKRRELLKWSAPVATSAVLPVHAQTSIVCINPEPSIQLQINSVTPSSGVFADGDTITVNVTYDVAGSSDSSVFIVVRSPNDILSGIDEISLTNGAASGTIDLNVDIFGSIGQSESSLVVEIDTINNSDPSCDPTPASGSATETVDILIDT